MEFDDITRRYLHQPPKDDETRLGRDQNYSFFEPQFIKSLPTNCFNFPFKSQILPLFRLVGIGHGKYAHLKGYGAFVRLVDSGMDEVPGSFGTSASLALRLGQCAFSIASLLFMCLDVQFYTYTSFSFLVIVLGLVTPWSIILAMLDMYSIFFRRPFHYNQQERQSLIFIIATDCTLCFLSLAAAASTASVVDYLITSNAPFCGREKLCSRYQLSAAMTFLHWFLLLGSSLFNLWLLPSL